MSPISISKLRASEIARRRTEAERAETLFSASDDDGGNPANIAPSGASNRTKRDARAARKEGEQ